MFKGNKKLIVTGRALLVGALFIFGLFFAANRANATTEIPGREFLGETVHWTKEMSPIVINGTVFFRDGSKLTIDPGVVIKIRDGMYFYIVDSEIVTDGKPDERIIFTSIKDDTGEDTNGDGDSSVPAMRDWGNVEFYGSQINTISYTEFRYGNYCLRLENQTNVLNSNFNSCFHAINLGTNFDKGDIISNLIDGNYIGVYALVTKTGKILKNRVLNNDWYGLYLDKVDDFVVEENTIEGNGYGVIAGERPNFTFKNNNLKNNLLYGFYNHDFRQMDARNNWWGDITGPRHPLNQGGIGDNIRGDVLFDPWLQKQASLDKKTPILIIPGITGTELIKS